MTKFPDVLRIVPEALLIGPLAQWEADRLRRDLQPLFNKAQNTVGQVKTTREELEGRVDTMRTRIDADKRQSTQEEMSEVRGLHHQVMAGDREFGDVIIELAQDTRYRRLERIEGRLIERRNKGNS